MWEKIIKYLILFLIGVLLFIVIHKVYKKCIDGFNVGSQVVSICDLDCKFGLNTLSTVTVDDTQILNRDGSINTTYISQKISEYLSTDFLQNRESIDLATITYTNTSVPDGSIPLNISTIPEQITSSNKTFNYFNVTNKNPVKDIFDRIKNLLFNIDHTLLVPTSAASDQTYYNMDIYYTDLNDMVNNDMDTSEYIYISEDIAIILNIANNKDIFQIMYMEDCIYYINRVSLIKIIHNLNIQFPIILDYDISNISNILLVTLYLLTIDGTISDVTKKTRICEMVTISFLNNIISTEYPDKVLNKLLYGKDIYYKFIPNPIILKDTKMDTFTKNFGSSTIFDNLEDNSKFLEDGYIQHLCCREIFLNIDSKIKLSDADAGQSETICNIDEYFKEGGIHKYPICFNYFKKQFINEFKVSNNVDINLLKSEITTLSDYTNLEQCNVENLMGVYFSNIKTSGIFSVMNDNVLSDDLQSLLIFILNDITGDETLTSTLFLTIFQFNFDYINDLFKIYQPQIKHDFYLIIMQLYTAKFMVHNESSCAAKIISTKDENENILTEDEYDIQTRSLNMNISKYVISLGGIPFYNQCVNFQLSYLQLTTMDPYATRKISTPVASNGYSLFCEPTPTPVEIMLYSQDVDDGFTVGAPRAGGGGAPRIGVSRPASPAIGGGQSRPSAIQITSLPGIDVVGTMETPLQFNFHDMMLDTTHAQYYNELENKFDIISRNIVNAPSSKDTYEKMLYINTANIAAEICAGFGDCLDQYDAEIQRIANVQVIMLDTLDKYNNIYTIRWRNILTITDATKNVANQLPITPAWKKDTDQELQTTVQMAQRARRGSYRYSSKTFMEELIRQTRSNYDEVLGFTQNLHTIRSELRGSPFMKKLSSSIDINGNVRRDNLDQLPQFVIDTYGKPHGSDVLALSVGTKSHVNIPSMMGNIRIIRDLTQESLSLFTTQTQCLVELCGALDTALTNPSNTYAYRGPMNPTNMNWETYYTGNVGAQQSVAGGGGAAAQVGGGASAVGGGGGGGGGASMASIAPQPVVLKANYLQKINDGLPLFFNEYENKYDILSNIVWELEPDYSAQVSTEFKKIILGRATVSITATAVSLLGNSIGNDHISISACAAGAGVLAFCFDYKNTWKSIQNTPAYTMVMDGLNACTGRNCLAAGNLVKDQSYIAEKYYKEFLKTLIDRHEVNINQASFKSLINDLKSNTPAAVSDVNLDYFDTLTNNREASEAMLDMYETNVNPGEASQMLGAFTNILSNNRGHYDNVFAQFDIRLSDKSMDVYRYTFMGIVKLLEQGNTENPGLTYTPENQVLLTYASNIVEQFEVRDRIASSYSTYDSVKQNILQLSSSSGPFIASYINNNMHELTDFAKLTQYRGDMTTANMPKSLREWLIDEVKFQDTNQQFGSTYDDNVIELAQEQFINYQNTFMADLNTHNTLTNFLYDAQKYNTKTNLFFSLCTLISITAAWVIAIESNTIDESDNTPAISDGSGSAGDGSGSAGDGSDSGNPPPGPPPPPELKGTVACDNKCFIASEQQCNKPGDICRTTNILNPNTQKEVLSYFGENIQQSILERLMSPFTYTETDNTPYSYKSIKNGKPVFYTLSTDNRVFAADSGSRDSSECCDSLDGQINPAALKGCAYQENTDSSDPDGYYFNCGCTKYIDQTPSSLRDDFITNMRGNLPAIGDGSGSIGDGSGAEFSGSTGDDDVDNFISLAVHGLKSISKNNYFTINKKIKLDFESIPQLTCELEEVASIEKCTDVSKYRIENGLKGCTWSATDFVAGNELGRT